MKLVIKVIVTFLKAIITGIVGPLNSLIIGNIPGLNTAISAVTSFVAWLKDFILWVMSWLPFSADMMNFLILALIFLLTIPVLTDMIKLVVKWWHALAP